MTDRNMVCSHEQNKAEQIAHLNTPVEILQAASAKLITNAIHNNYKFKDNFVAFFSLLWGLFRL